MTLRNVLVTMLVFWLGLVGMVCGFLCLACLVLVVFWQGLGVGTLILALVCLLCLGLAFVLAGGSATTRPTEADKERSLVGRLWSILRGPTSEFDDVWKPSRREQEEWVRHAKDKS
jgi:hypothetical protein